MANHRSSKDLTKKAARYRAIPSLVLLLLLLTAIPSLVPAAWAARKHPTKTPPKENPGMKKPGHEISFDYRMGADGHNEFLIFGNAPMKNHKTFLLDNPPRLVLDIPGVTLPGNTAAFPINGSVLSRIRIARHPDKVRFVFDLPEGKNIRNKVIARNKELKVLLSQDQASSQPPASAAAQNPVEKTPAPSSQQIQTMSDSELEQIFGSQRVSVVFHKTPIREFAQYLSEKSDHRIEVSPELAISVSLKFTEVPLHTLVHAAADTLGLALQQEGERILLLPAELQPPVSGQKKREAS